MPGAAVPAVPAGLRGEVLHLEEEVKRIQGRQPPKASLGVYPEEGHEVAVDRWCLEVLTSIAALEHEVESQGEPFGRTGVFRLEWGLPRIRGSKGGTHSRGRHPSPKPGGDFFRIDVRHFYFSVC
jgi:hypothetical protein